MSSGSSNESAPLRREYYTNRKTNETEIEVQLSLDGGSPITGHAVKNKHASQASTTQEITIESGIGFLDHMLHALAKHAGWSLYLSCKGDLYSFVPPCYLSPSS